LCSSLGDALRHPIKYPRPEASYQPDYSISEHFHLISLLLKEQFRKALAKLIKGVV
jgi:hypothetical protein